jgi:hypothetical protein
MLRTFTINHLRTALVCTALTVACVSASFAGETESTFARLQFGDDVSIEVPRNWTFLDPNIRSHLNTYSEAVAKLSGIDVNQGNNQILVAANAYTERNKKPAATVRLSVRVGSVASQAEVKAANLGELRREAESTLEKLQKSGSLPADVRGMKLLDVRLEKLGGLYTIVYDKQVDYDSGHEIDRLDVIYLGNKVFKLNTSWKRDVPMFEPIIRRIRQSLALPAR